MVSTADMILEHAFDAYAKRISNKPKGFFGTDDARTAEYTGMDWGAENKLKNRTKRINLEDEQTPFLLFSRKKNQKICKIWYTVYMRNQTLRNAGKYIEKWKEKYE